MKQHELKAEKEYFQEAITGSKLFEIRKDDRGFEKGDMVKLHEWNKEEREYTGRSCSCRITYVTDYAQKPGHVVFGVEFL